MSRRNRQRQRRRIRLHMSFRSLLPFFVIGLSCLLQGRAARASPPSTAVDNEDSITDDTFQTVSIPLSPLEFRIDGKPHTDAAKLTKAKNSLTLAFSRLLRSHYGNCLDHVNLKVSLEQVEPMPMPMSIPMPFAAVDEDGDKKTSNQLEQEKAILIAKATATLHCKSSDMPSLSIKDVDEIIGRSIETFKHVASIVFTSSSQSNNLYHSLVRIAFNASEARDVPTSRSNGQESHSDTISSALKLDVDYGNDLLAIGSRSTVDEENSAISTKRLLESDVTCVPQVAGRIKLMRGEFICSPSLEYSFGLTLKGDLSLLRHGDTIWSVSNIYFGLSV
jgi:hypothetical protein